jgi:diguanylate cyclase (GGDEF)-like protein/PAS domain S-box-containing protein
MYSNGSYVKALIVSDKNYHFSSYKAILRGWVDEIDTYDLSQDKKEEFGHYELIICDISLRKHIVRLPWFFNAKKENIGKLILVVPYTIEQLMLDANSAKMIDFIMGKPLDVDKLIAYAKTQLSLMRKQAILDKKNRVLSDVIDLNMIKIGVFDLKGTLYYANAEYLAANKQNITAFDKIRFNDLVRCQEKFETILDRVRARSTFSMERQEAKQWFRSYFYFLHGQYVVHLCQDITDEKFYIQNLERAATFFENSQEGMIITDSKGRITSINRAFSKITGYTRPEALGKTPALLKSGMHEEEFYQNLWDSLTFNGRWQGEIWNKRKNGEIYPEWLSISKIEESSSKEVSYMAIFTDISSIKEADKKLHYYANYDQLTGLCNRVQFDNLFNHALATAKRKGWKMALMFLDLDNFKEVNDTHGHNIGDLMLKKVARKLQATLRKNDIIARIGGDEFTVLLEGIKDQKDAMDVAVKLNEVTKEPIEIDGNVFFMSLSVGIAIFPTHGEDVATLSKHADTAMYEIKSRGRNGVMIYNSQFTDKIVQRVNLLNELKTAISQDQFKMLYQPIIDLKTNSVVGAEALIRWEHPQKGVISPADFIVFAEENNLIIDLGQLVLRKSLEDFLSLSSAVVSEFRLAINVSGQEFFAQNYIQSVERLLKDFNVPPSAIELEITETYVMGSPKVAAKIMEKLHEVGVYISLDDFGTGYSSLGYLKHFPIDKLKIDQSFIRDFMDDEKEMALVKTIINMAKLFGMQVHAEGVEQDSQSKALLELDCDVVQGYAYAKPLPLIEFVKYCKEFK